MNWYDISMPLITSELHLPALDKIGIPEPAWFLLAGVHTIFGQRTLKESVDIYFEAEKPYLIRKDAFNYLFSAKDFLCIPLINIPMVSNKFYEPHLLLEGVIARTIMQGVQVLLDFKNNRMHPEILYRVQQLLRAQLDQYRITIRLPSDVIMIDRFKKLVQANLATQHSLDFYLKILYCGERTFYTLCRQVLGVSPQCYIHQEMIQSILKGIRNKQSFQDIADNHGFKEYSHFSRFVKKYSGLTPQEWRRYYG